jgi:hypothetical protein
MSAHVSEESDQNTAEERLDLSQFEGHTTGPWHQILMQGDEYNNGYLDLQNLGFNGAAQDLIAAAPDLLAELIKEREEVKRLREENELVKLRLDREERYVQLLHHEFHEEQKLMFTDEFNEKVSEIYEPQDGGEEENED